MIIDIDDDHATHTEKPHPVVSRSGKIVTRVDLDPDSRCAERPLAANTSNASIYFTILKKFIYILPIYHQSIVKILIVDRFLLLFQQKVRFYVKNNEILFERHAKETLGCWWNLLDFQWKCSQNVSNEWNNIKNLPVHPFVTKNHFKTTFKHTNNTQNEHSTTQTDVVKKARRTNESMIKNSMSNHLNDSSFSVLVFKEHSDTC